MNCSLESIQEKMCHPNKYPIQTSICPVSMACRRATHLTGREEKRYGLASQMFTLEQLAWKEPSLQDVNVTIMEKKKEKKN